MKITKYQKSKKNTYIVQLDDKEYELYDDIIIKYSLLLKKEIDAKDFQKIIEENNSLLCYYKALNYLSKKMRTKKEIETYLEKQAFDKIIIQNVLSKLINQKYLDDEKYIDAYLHDCLKFQKYGPKKISEKLTKLGLPSDMIYQKISSIDVQLWQEKCQELVKKKALIKHKESKKVWEQKIIKYFLNEGYELVWIKNALENVTIESDPLLIKKEYEKIYKKYSRKYENDQLQYKIYNYMRAKGYTNEEISNL